MFRLTGVGGQSRKRELISRSCERDPDRQEREMRQKLKRDKQIFVQNRFSYVYHQLCIAMLYAMPRPQSAKNLFRVQTCRRGVRLPFKLTPNDSVIMPDVSSRRNYLDPDPISPIQPLKSSSSHSGPPDYDNSPMCSGTGLVLSQHSKGMQNPSLCLPCHHYNHCIP
jgi:hypothetical protein